MGNRLDSSLGSEPRLPARENKSQRRILDKIYLKKKKIIIYALDKIKDLII